MRISFYIIGSLIFFLALLGFIAAFGLSNSFDQSTGYDLASALLVGGTLILIAAIENYKGGFLVSICQFIRFVLLLSNLVHLRLLPARRFL
jgi:hypothetical protein